MKVKTNYDKCGYITAGKVYETLADLGSDTAIKDDEGETIWIDFGYDGCPHLRGDKWVVISQGEKPFDISEHEFLESDIQGAEIVGKILRLHLMSSDLPYIEKSKDDVIAEAKALGVTADDLK